MQEPMRKVEPITYRTAMARSIVTTRMVQCIKSRGALAKLSGISVPTLGKIESGKQELTYRQLCALADAFGIQPINLLTFSVQVYEWNGNPDAPNPNIRLVLPASGTNK